MTEFEQLDLSFGEEPKKKLSFDEQLKELVKGLKKNKPEPVAIIIQANRFPQPNKWRHEFEVFVPPDYVSKPATYEFWNYDGIPLLSKLDYNLIYHGHEKQFFCRRTDYCHVYGYRPTGDEGEFAENFYKKWRYLKND